MKRKDSLAALISPLPRFLLGFCVLVIFITVRLLSVKILFVILFAILAGFSGKRIWWLYFSTFLFFVVFFHLLSPFGRVFAKVGPLALTQGALLAGLSKGFLFIGFVFNSLFTVDRKLSIPGRFGRIISEMFVFFESLYEGKKKVRASSLFSDIDSVMKDAFENPSRGGEAREQVPLFRSAAVAAVFLAVFGSLKAAEILFFSRVLPF